MELADLCEEIKVLREAMEWSGDHSVFDTICMYTTYMYRQEAPTAEIRKNLNSWPSRFFCRAAEKLCLYVVHGG